MKADFKACIQGKVFKTSHIQCTPMHNQDHKAM